LAGSHDVRERNLLKMKSELIMEIRTSKEAREKTN